MGTLRLYELPREVQKLIGRSGGILPPKNLEILQPLKSVLRPYTGPVAMVSPVQPWPYRFYEGEKWRRLNVLSERFAVAWNV